MFLEVEKPVYRINLTWSVQTHKRADKIQRMNMNRDKKLKEVDKMIFFAKNL